MRSWFLLKRCVSLVLHHIVNSWWFWSSVARLSGERLWSAWSIRFTWRGFFLQRRFLIYLVSPIVWHSSSSIRAFKLLHMGVSSFRSLHSAIFSVLVEFPTVSKIWNSKMNQSINLSSLLVGSSEKEPNSKRETERVWRGQGSTHFHHRPCHRRTLWINNIRKPKSVDMQNDRIKKFLNNERICHLWQLHWCWSSKKSSFIEWRRWKTFLFFVHRRFCRFCGHFCTFNMCVIH